MQVNYYDIMTMAVTLDQKKVETREGYDGYREKLIRSIDFRFYVEGFF